jgi:flagellar biosynthesis protein FlhG
MGRKFALMDQASTLRKMVNGKTSASGQSGLKQAVKPDIVSSPCRSIAIVSGKGGVGKSNISLMLAQSLARLGKKVLLFDADLGLANIHILLGLNPRYNLSHVIRGECDLSQAVCTGPDGINIVPGASGVENMANLEPLSVEQLVRRFSELEAVHDFILIDTGAGIGQLSVRLASAAESAIIVVTPEPTSLADAYAITKVLFSHGMTHIYVMVNMAVTDKEGTEVFDKLKTLVKNFLKKEITLAGILPYDRDIPRLVRLQQSMTNAKPSSAAVLRTGAFARNVCGISASGAKPGFFKRLFGVKQS